MKNRAMWATLVRECGGDREKVIQELDAYLILREHDLDSVKVELDSILRMNKSQEFLRAGDLVPAIVNRLAKDSFDPGLRDALKERAEEVCAMFKINPRKGLINPYHEKPAPTSRDLAAAGNAR